MTPGDPQAGTGLIFTFVLGLVLGVVATVTVSSVGDTNVIVDGSPVATAPTSQSDASAAPDSGATSSTRGGATAPAATEAEAPTVAAAPGAPAARQDSSSSGAGSSASSSRPAAGSSEPSDSGGTDDGTTAPRSASGSNGGATFRGVSAEAIKIGIAVPDLGALRALGPEYDNGDPEAQWRAMYDGWKKDELLPIHGRDIELIFDDYDVLDASSQNATCKALVQDQQVFAVVAIAYYRVGSECVAKEENTPLLTTDGPSDSQLARSYPNLFSLGMSNNRIVRNMLHFAADVGILDGKTVGVYHFNDAENEELKEDILSTLEGFGIARDEVTVHSTDQDLGGPQDAVAVQRFQSNGVNLAILLTSKAGFMRQANSQQYFPTYIESDHAFGTSDTAASSYPPEQFDQTRGITGRRVGETSAGEPLDAKQEACLQNFERVEGRRPEAETAEWSYILMNCDLGEVLLQTLEKAGPELTHATYIGAMETVSIDPVRYGPISFAPDRHHGTIEFRPVRWHADCTCWKAESTWQPLYVR